MIGNIPNIKIGNELLKDALLSLVEVTQELNRHWWCTVACRQTHDQRIPVEDLLGNEIEVKTTDDQGVEHIHFSGFILDVRLVYEVWGSYTAHLTAVSSSYTLDVAAHKQYYAEQTLSAVSGTISGRNNLAIDVHAADNKALNYVQYAETDFSFLNRIVDDHRAWLRPKQGGIEIFDTFQSGSSVTWRGENDLIEFSLSGKLTPASFNGAHYDHHARSAASFKQVSKPPEFYDGAQHMTSSVQTASKRLPAGFEPQRARAVTLSDYQTQLQDESERSIGRSITASGQSRNQLLMAGNTIKIEGVDQGDGTYGLIKVTHEWTPQGYSNSFLCTPWKNYRNPEPPSARTWSGIVPATVVDHNDPKKMGRIKVQFFWQADGSTHWARTTSPHAGQERGFMFMPEVGDEVAVAFEDGDPEKPVILGSLWNGVQTQNRKGYYGDDTAGNDVKCILTKSGNRIHIADRAGSEAITIATPKNGSLTISENHAATGRPLVTLNSTGDIVLNAPNGRVHIKSKVFSREVG